MRKSKQNKQSTTVWGSADAGHPKQQDHPILIPIDFPYNLCVARFEANTMHQCTEQKHEYSRTAARAIFMAVLHARTGESLTPRGSTPHTTVQSVQSQLIDIQKQTNKKQEEDRTGLNLAPVC